MGKIKEILLKIWTIIKNFFIKLKNIIISLFKKIKSKEIPKKTKNNIIKIFGIIGVSVGKLINKKTDVSKELDKANKEKIKIEKALDNETEIVVIRMYKKQVTKTIKKLDKIDNAKDREEQKEIKKVKNDLVKLQEKIIKVEAKINDEVNILDIKNEEESIIKTEEPIINKEIIKSKNSESSRVKEISKKTGNYIKNKSIKVGKTTGKGVAKVAKKTCNFSKKAGAIVASSVGAIVANVSNKAKIKKEKRQEYKELKNSIREINLKINRAYKEISKIKNNYSDTKLQELLFVKEKVLDIKEDYITLRSAKNFKMLKVDKNIDNIDPNHLSHHGNAIYDLIDYVELSINEVKEGRITPKPEVKKEPVIKKEKIITFDLNDFILVKESIEKDITSSLNDVVKIKNEINDIPFKYKKSRLLNRICGFFKFSMNTAISLIPFGVFKNKFVATFTSGVILNNRIKSMRSLIYNKRVEFIDYESIINNINDKTTCLSNTSYVLLDTVKSIDEVSSKLMEEYPNNQEALKLIKNLEEMKIDLLEENVKIETMLEDLGKNKVKIKVQ